MKKVSTPCTGMCGIGDHGYCVSCKRSKKEIAQWVLMTEESRIKVLEDLKNRNLEA